VVTLSLIITSGNKWNKAQIHR